MSWCIVIGPDVQISRGAEAEKAKLKLQTASCLEIGVIDDERGSCLAGEMRYQQAWFNRMEKRRLISYLWRPSVRLFSAGVLVVQGEFE